MKTSLNSSYASSKGAALVIVLALALLLTSIALAYFSRTTTDRQLAQSSYNDTSADLLARSALDITVSDLKQEIASYPPPVNKSNIQPLSEGTPLITDPQPIPNLIRRSFSGDHTHQTSSVSSGAASANGRVVSPARWNSHYLIPRASTTTNIDSTPIASFTVPDWVLVTAQGPTPSPSPSAVIGRYAFAVYDEGGLININVGGFPTYAGATMPARPTRRLANKYSIEESEIMLAACSAPNFAPDHENESGNTGSPFSCGPYHVTHNPITFGANFLPHGLSINTSTGAISGTPTSPGSFTITLSASNTCGTGYAVLNLTINGLPSPDSSPWPVNLARKGTVAFADVTTLPSTPTVVTPTTPVGIMGNFPPTTQINKIMGWRNYATTQQPTSASFDNPSFPPVAATEDLFARYFLGAALPFSVPFTTVPTSVQNGRTDQGLITRQELIKLQRTIGFSQSLLQYLGTFSRETNRPASDWSQTLGTRWDMNYLAVAIPDSWIVYPGHHGQGHAWGQQQHTQFAQRFGLVWQNGTFTLGARLTDPNYYGRWRYVHNLNDWPASPDFFQVINNAMKQANGGVSPDPKTVFTVGAALIDQYDTDDLYDPDPNPPNNGNLGNTITIIDTLGNGNPADYVYGIEGMSYNDPTLDLARPGPYCQYPPPAPLGYALLNRRFENIGEFGYAYNPASTTPSKTLDFASSTSRDRVVLDFFTYNSAGGRAGVVNLNTRNGPVLASIIRGAWLRDPGAEIPPPDATYLVSQSDALAAGQAIVQETTSTVSGHGPALTRADVARLAGAVAAAVPTFNASDETKQAIARALAEAGQTRTWNLMIDVIAQTGRYAPGTMSITDANKFTVEGEKRYWLHIALDRDTGNVLGTQLEEVID